MSHAKHRVPQRAAWLFPEVNVRTLDADRDAHYVLARILESGTLLEVAWCVQFYGFDRIRRFFREEGDPTLSLKTIALWRLVLDANDETWVTPRRSRLRRVAPWPG